MNRSYNLASMNNNFSFSKLSIYIIILAVLVSLYSKKHWNSENRVIAWDVISYYGYLPATFIYQDLSFEFIDNYKGDHEFLIWAEIVPNGNKIMKMSMGLSFLYLPFFLLAHIFALITEFDAGGYSAPYKFALQLSSLFYLVIGLFYLRKIMLRYFSENVTALSLLLVFFATNLYYYSTHEATMPHSYNFALFAVFVWLTMKWYENSSVKNSIYLGLLGGLIILIRPSNILIIFFFIFWGIDRLNKFKERLFLYYNHLPKIFLMILMVLLVWVPQIIYWKIQTGNYFYFSYQGERFFFNDPIIIDGFFSYRKGWLLYTPIMSFALIGIFFLRKKLSAFFIPILIFTLFNSYLILSWWCWWYGGSFGQRAFIDSYALLIIPLAAFLSYFLNKQKPWLTRLVYGFSFFFIIHGVFQTRQYYSGAIHWDSMSKASYWDSFGRDVPSEKFNGLLITPDYEKAKQGER